MPAMCSSSDFSRFGIDTHTGFMGVEPPLRRLSGVFEIWERFLDEAFAHFVHTGTSPELTVPQRNYAFLWRKRIRAIRVLDCLEIYNDHRKLQRAHHVLAFLTQFYVHSLPPRHPSRHSYDPITIPATISVPFVAVSRKLDIAPIVTYADAVLWNWDLIDPSLPLSRTNIKIRDLFTGSKQEEHFFLTSARIEIEGWEALDAIRQAIGQSESKDPSIELAAHHLRRLSHSIDRITDILFAVRDNLDPHFFYNRFRPWIQGADQGAESPPWLYEGVDSVGLILQPSGPSAGQSALMHAFDVFLDVPHPHQKGGLGGGCTRFNSALDPHNRSIVEKTIKALPEDHPPVALPLTPPPTPPFAPKSLELSFPTEIEMGASAPIDTSFNARMRSYMIQDHQEFLLHLAQRSIRGFVQSYRREATRLTASAEEEKEEEEEKESKGDAIPDPDPASSPFSARAARRHALSELFVAYDAAVLALKRWRDAHIIIVTQYVIVPARALNGANEPGARTYVQVDKRTGEATEVARESKPVRGTGGTSLIPLLKIYRNNTLGRLFGHR